MPPEERASRNVTNRDIEDSLLDIIRSEGRKPEFIGARFPELNFEHAYFVQSDKTPIRFDYSVFTGDVEFSNADMGLCYFSGSDFHKSVSFHNAEFLQKAIFTNCRFRDRASFSADYHHYVNFDGSTFDSDFYFPADCNSGVTIREVLFKGEANLRHGDFPDGLNLRDSVVKDGLFLDNSTTERLILDLQEIRGNDIVDLSAAKVRSGYIEQPDIGKMYCNFTQATIGDLVVSIDKTPFNYLYFEDTDFDGFDFTSHHSDLRESGWKIHGFGSPDFEDDRSPFSLETTYLKARHGANNYGDNKSASEFFMKEMQFRKKGHLQSFKTSDGLVEKTANLVKYLSNSTLGLISGYGERPLRVVIISALTVVGFALAFPLFEGIAQDGRVIEYQRLSFTEIVATFLDSLYFSVVTFTTVGYGDMQPAGGITAGLAALESFLGVFLMALLIFVLGRSIKW